MVQNALKLEQALYDLINDSGVSVETAYFILKTVLYDFEKELPNYIQAEGQSYKENNTYKFDESNTSSATAQINFKEITENEQSSNRDNA